MIEGVKPYDGRYDFDIEGRELTTREWGWLKRLSGYLPLTIEKGLEGGDPELITAMAVVALHRAGKITTAEAPAVFDRIIDAPFGSTVRLESDDVAAGEDEDRPPTPSSPESETDSGAASMTKSETSPETRNGYGTPDSDTSEWRRPTLAT